MSTAMSQASMIIASHNHGHLLGDAIDSALAQTHPCEVVVVDDGSADNTPQVLEAYGTRIVSLMHPNAGQGTAISRGITKATGEVILLLDADDLVVTTRVEKVLDVLRREPQAMWVRHGLRLADSDGRVLDAPPMYIARSDPETDIVTRGRTSGTTSVLALRRALWDVIGPVPPEYTGYADVYMLIAAGLTAPHAHIPEPLTIRRLHQRQHFTVNSVERTRDSRFHIQLRAHAARDAARIAQLVDGSAEVASGKTWWQLRAQLDLAKAEGHLRAADVARLVRQLLGRLGRARLPWAVRVLAAGRAIVLSLAPQSLFPVLWWWTNEGRRRRHRVV